MSSTILPWLLLVLAVTAFLGRSAFSRRSKGPIDTYEIDGYVSPHYHWVKEQRREDNQ